MTDLSNISQEEKVKLAQAIKKVKDYQKYNRLEYYCKKKKFHKWQMEFFAAGAYHKEKFALCGNRTGKTFSGMAEVAMHLTGEYPFWWTGRRFNKAIKAVICGKSGENMRDTTHELLVGVLEKSDEKGKNFESDGTGWIPKDKIIKADMSPAVKGFAKDIKIKHKLGTSVVSFRSYSQGHMAVAGMTLDLVAIDEEPEFDSLEFFAQCKTRTLTTDGMVMILATPEHGLTPLVDQFMNHRQPHQYLANVGWEDCDHITPQMIKEQLATIPKYQHKMRKDGLPVFSEGLVYPFAEESITCAPFAVPDYWEKVGGMDVGFSHYTTMIQSAWDKENDIVYVYSEYGEQKLSPTEHTVNILGKVGCRFPIVLPHDSINIGRDGAEPLKTQYENCGLNIDSLFENPEGGNNVAIGLLEIYTRMQSGRLKIFANCENIIKEMRKYRYNGKKGVPIKEDDDFVDGMRYSVMSLLAGKGVVGNPKNMTYQQQTVVRYSPKIY